MRRIIKLISAKATITTALMCICFVFTACKESSTNVSNDDNSSIFYIIGYDMQSVLDTANGIGKARVYLLVSENLEDTLATHQLPDSLFTFPIEILFSGNCCGFMFFLKNIDLHIR